MACSSMHVEAVLASGPEAVIRHPRERGDDRMRESHPEKPELATMRVAREDEVRRPTGEVTEGARIRGASRREPRPRPAGASR